MRLSDPYSLDLSGVCLYHFPDWTVSRDAVKHTRHNKTARLVWRTRVEMIFLYYFRETNKTILTCLFKILKTCRSI